MPDVSIAMAFELIGADKIDQARAMLEQLAGSSEQARGILEQLNQQFPRVAEGAKTAGNAAGGAGEGFGELGKAIADAMGFGAAFAGGMVALTAALEGIRELTVGAAEDFGKLGNQLYNLHASLGVPVELGYAWKETEEVTGLSVQRIVQQLTMMETRLTQGTTQSVGAFALVFKNMNTTLGDFMAADVATKMDLLSQAMQTSGLSAEQFAVAMRELGAGGRGGSSIVAALQPDVMALQKEIEQDTVMTKEAVAQAREWTLATTHLRAAWHEVTLEIGSALDKALLFVLNSHGNAPMWGGTVAPSYGGLLEDSGGSVPGGDFGLGALNASLMSALAGNARHAPTFVTEKDRAEALKLQAEQDKFTEAAEKSLADTMAKTTGGMDAEIDRIYADAGAKLDNAMRTKAWTEAGQEAIIAAADLSAGALRQKEAFLELEDAYKRLQAASKTQTKLDDDFAQSQTKLDEAIAASASPLDREILGLQAAADAQAIKVTNDAQAAAQAALAAGATDEQAQAIYDERDATLANIAVTESWLASNAQAKSDLAAITAEWKAEADAAKLAAQIQSQALKSLGDDFKDIGKTLGDFGAGTGVTSMFADLSQGMDIASQAAATGTLTWGQMATALGSIYTEGEKAGAAMGALGGAAEGASIGAVAGPWGAAIGAVVGGVVGLIGGLQTPEYDKVMSDVGTHWGTDITEALGKQIASTETKDNVSRFLAELLNIDAIIQQSGQDPANFATHIGDLMNALADNAVPAKDAVTELNKAFQDLQKSAADGSQASADAMVQMILRARQLGETIPDMAKAVAQSMTDSTKGIDTMFKGFETAMKGGFIMDPALIMDNATIFTNVFWADVKELGLSGAINALGPAFQNLQNEFGRGQAQPPFMAELDHLFGLMKSPQFKGLADAAQGGTQALTGVSGAGYLTEAGFQASEDQARQLLKSLEARGATQTEATQLLAPYLSQIEKSSQEYGYKIDKQTQELIDQAQKEGVGILVDPAHATVGLLQQIRDILAGHSGGSGGYGAGGYVPPGFDTGGGGLPGGGRYHGGRVPRLAEGAYVDTPTLAVVGEAGPEYVIPARGLSTTQPAPFTYTTGMGLAGGGAMHVEVGGMHVHVHAGAGSGAREIAIAAGEALDQQIPQFIQKLQQQITRFQNQSANG